MRSTAASARAASDGNTASNYPGSNKSLTPEEQMYRRRRSRQHRRQSDAGLESGGDLDMDIEASNLVKGINQLESSYIAGCTVVTSLLDLLVCQSYFNPYIVALMNIFLLGRRRGSQQVEQGVATTDEAGTAGGSDPAVAYRPVPSEMHGREFGCLFDDTLRSSGAIVIGLYRQSDPHVYGSGGVQHYVCTNPRSNVILHPTDCMYIIESEKASPFGRRASWDGS